MIIYKATFNAATLPLLSHFYVNILGLQVELESDVLSISVGISSLVFVQAPDFGGNYHLAFEIPRNLVNEAQNWLTQRVVLLEDQDGTTRFEPTEEWNTTNLYFKDPAGNILEFIARHDRPTEQSGPFTARHILNVSEVGVVVADVPDAVAQLTELYGLRPFNGQSNTFTPVGDHDGMLIVVPRDRGWFPIRQPAVSAPLSIEFSQGAEVRTLSISAEVHDER